VPNRGKVFHESIKLMISNSFDVKIGLNQLCSKCYYNNGAKLCKGCSNPGYNRMRNDLHSSMPASLAEFMTSLLHNQ